MIPWQGAPKPPRRWQAEALPIIIEALRRKERGIVSAVMGSGKSILQAELAWMALERLGDRAIVISAPRQALVRQLHATIAARCGAHRVGMFYGAVKQPERPIIVTCNPSTPKLREVLGARKVALFIPDEAHGTEGAVLKEAIPAIEPACLVGFTATPYRSIPSQTVSLFDSIIYRYTLADGLADGVLVPMRHVRYEGTIQPDEVDVECLIMMERHGDGPGIVSARSIPDAEAYAAWLTEHGFKAEPIHSKQKDRERLLKLQNLERGRIRCLVHVSLLAEGVDMPWLRWLCLRRPVQARVRFLQEVGRVLRVHPGKSEGIILDPHLLLGVHGLTTAEAIGKALEEAAEVEAAEPGAGKREEEEREVVALDVLSTFLSELYAKLAERGVIKPRNFEGSGWRLADASQKQIDALKTAKQMTRYLPKAYREPLKALIKIPHALTFGQMHDLLTVLYSSGQWADKRAKEKQQPKYFIHWPACYAEGVRIPEVRL